MAAVAFATFFATIGPFDLAALFAALTPYHTTGQRRSIAFRGVVLASVILMIFALPGNGRLEYPDLSLAALRISGGIQLFLLSISMVFGEQTFGPSSSEAECLEASQKGEISVFTLAMPLIA